MLSPRRRHACTTNPPFGAVDMLTRKSRQPCRWHNFTITQVMGRFRIGGVTGDPIFDLYSPNNWNKRVPCMTKFHLFKARDGQNKTFLCQDATISCTWPSTKLASQRASGIFKWKARLHGRAIFILWIVRLPYWHRRPVVITRAFQRK